MKPYVQPTYIISPELNTGTSFCLIQQLILENINIGGIQLNRTIQGEQDLLLDLFQLDLLQLLDLLILLVQLTQLQRRGLLVVAQLFAGLVVTLVRREGLQRALRLQDRLGGFRKGGFGNHLDNNG